MQRTEKQEFTTSRGTRFMGISLLLGIPTLLIFSFLLSPADDNMNDAVRLIYVHVPLAIFAYVAIITTGIGSVLYLWKKISLVGHCRTCIGRNWPNILWSSACYRKYLGKTNMEYLVGMGRCSPGNDPCSILMILGYLALRQVPANPDLRAKRSSVVGIIAAVNIPIVNRSVEWWENNTLHQKSSLTDGKLENLTLFTLFLGFIIVGISFLWLMTHRFRVGWLVTEIETDGIEGVIEERLNEGISVDGNSNYQPKDEVQ